MVTLEYIKASAIRNRRHDVGRAFCRALGLCPEPRARGAWGRDAYAGVRECMANRGSPMDGRR